MATRKTKRLTIQDISPLIADHFIDINVTKEETESYQKLVIENTVRLGLFYKYLNRLHDCCVLDSVITEGKYSLTLNDLATQILAEVLNQTREPAIEQEKLVFPVRLDFETEDISFYTVDEHGRLGRIKPFRFDEYLREYMISFNKTNFNIGLVVWEDAKRGPFGRRVLITLRVKNVEVTELQDQAWTEIFGNEFDEYYRHFKDNFDTRLFLADQSMINDLVDECRRLYRSH